MTISSALLMVAASIARLLDLSDAITMNGAFITQSMLLTTSTTLLVTLLRVSVQSGLLIGAIWLLCRLAPRMPAAVRAGLWWIAGLSLIVGVAAPRPIALPVLPLSIAPASASPSMSPSASRSAHNAPATRGAQTSGQAAAPAAERTAASLLAAGASRQAVSASPAAASSSRSSLSQPSKRSKLSWLSSFFSPAFVSPAFFSPAALARGARLWPLVLAGVWLGCVGWRLWRLARLRHRLAALVARGVDAPIEVQALFQRLCARVPRWQRPALRVSGEIDTPQVSGARRPVILLPAGMIARLSADELSMTLCHELTHVTRGDLWLGWIPAVARDLFFFHPLAALAAREYGVAREAACDAAVIHRLDAVPHDYGRLLVTLGVSSPRAARHAPLAAAGSASSVHLLKRRLLMLQHLPVRPGYGRVWWALAAAALVGLVPVQLVGQRAGAQADARTTTSVGVAGGMTGGVATGVGTGASGGVAGGVATAVAGGVDGGVAGGVSTGVSGGVAGTSATAGIASGGGSGGGGYAASVGSGSGNGSGSASGVNAGGSSGVSSGDGGGIGAGVGAGHGAGPIATASGSGSTGSLAIAGRVSLGSDDGEQKTRWIYIKNAHSVSMNGSDRDVEKVRALQAGRDERVLWFSQNGEEYLVRDPALLQKVEALFAPQEELGRAQSALGERQSALGDEQSKLGEKQSALGAQQSDQGAQHAKLAAVRARATARQFEAEADAAENKPAATVQAQRKEAERQLAEVARIEREINDRQAVLGERQAALGREQEALGRKQEELGRQQEVLGRKQEEVSRQAERGLKELMSQAIASGTAQKLR